MSENCSHNCEGCSQACESRERKSLLFAPNDMSHIGKIVGVVSGKGGVGKSLVTSLLAARAQTRGWRAGILDADVTGPSIPKMFGVHEKARGNELGMFPACTRTGVQVMSLNLLTENETDPVVWRGPVISGVVKQFYTDVIWEDVDYLFIDMPPGTGDVALTVFQSIPLDNLIIVATPQELVGMIVEKAVNMAGMMHIPVTALVENMSYAVCPDCGKRHAIFGESRVDEIAKKHAIGTVARLPLDPAIAAACDAGGIEALQNDWLDGVLDACGAIARAQ